MSRVERIGFYFVLILILGMLAMIVFSTNGVTDYRALKEKEHEVNARLQLESTHNREMEEEIRRLKQDINYIKHLAKHEHDMAEPDELIFKDRPAEKDRTP